MKMDRKRSLLMLNCAIYLFMFGVGIITPILPGKILAFSGSTVQVGLLASAFACSYLLVQIPLGVLADKFGYKTFIALGYFICGVAGFIYLLAGSSSLILVGRFMQGIGEAPLWALAPAILSILYPTSKARVIGWYNASLHIGLTSGSICGFVAYGYLPEQYAFIIFVLLCLVAGILTLMGGDEKAVHCSPREKDCSVDWRAFLQLITQRKIFCVLLGIVIYGAGYGIYITIIPAFFLEGQHLSPNSVGLLFIGFYIGISIAQLIGGYVADKMGRVLPMVTGLSLFAVGQILFPFFAVSYAIVFLSIASFGLGLFLIGSIAILNDQVDSNSKGLISGLFYLFWGGGYFLGPMILGYIAEQGYLIQGFITLGGMSAFVGLLLLLANRTVVARDAR